jgi:hypothetical protein
MLQVKAVKDVTARTRLRRKLDEKRWEEVSTILLIEVPEVEVKVRNRPQSCFT